MTVLLNTIHIGMMVAADNLGFGLLAETGSGRIDFGCDNSSSSFCTSVAFDADDPSPELLSFRGISSSSSLEYFSADMNKMIKGVS